jgi:hypothetical protein
MTPHTPSSRLAEWADLVGDSVPDGVDEPDRSETDRASTEST